MKGYTIGVEVFGRPADFDAQSDALVRVEAGRLRRRLVEYYAGEGAADPVRIELPRGTLRRRVPLRLPATSSAAPRRPRRRAAGGRATLVPVAARRVRARRAARRRGRRHHLAAERRLREAERTLALLDEPQRTEWPRIVVVPFENLSADVALDALAASMTEEIMLRLDELDLFVIASQASWYGAERGDEPRYGSGGRLRLDRQRARQRGPGAHHGAAHRGRNRGAALDGGLRRAARARSATGAAGASRARRRGDRGAVRPDLRSRARACAPLGAGAEAARLSRHVSRVSAAQ